MLEELSAESKNKLNTFMFIWFLMLGAQIIYLFVCYYILKEGLYKSIYSLEILNKNIYLGIDLYTLIHIVSILILIAGYFFFTKNYSKLVDKTNKTKFQNIEEEFDFFSTKYISMMFVYLAIFEIIAIIGLLVFLTTLDFYTAMNLIIIAVIGFILVMPNKNKFNYNAS
ncbi:MAG: hypothetical protein C0625_07070 [Arcobacter sp.]|nr:MAG: hypothetical protein C0625_07070 [Arcobacter sp.]